MCQREMHIIMQVKCSVIVLKSFAKNNVYWLNNNNYQQANKKCKQSTNVPSGTLRIPSRVNKVKRCETAKH